MDQRRGEVEPPAHPARVGADAAVGGLARGRPGRAARRRGASPSSPASPCRVACSRISSRPVISGSSAASWRATPIARRTSAASLTTSWPATRALPPVGRRSVVSIRTVVVLPGAVGAEEGVDLALGDLEVDAVDRADAPRELPLEPL